MIFQIHPIDGLEKKRSTALICHLSACTTVIELLDENVGKYLQASKAALDLRRSEIRLLNMKSHISRTSVTKPMFVLADLTWRRQADSWQHRVVGTHRAWTAHCAVPHPAANGICLHGFQCGWVPCCILRQTWVLFRWHGMAMPRQCLMLLGFVYIIYILNHFDISWQ